LYLQLIILQKILTQQYLILSYILHY